MFVVLRRESLKDAPVRDGKWVQDPVNNILLVVEITFRRLAEAPVQDLDGGRAAEQRGDGATRL